MRTAPGTFYVTGGTLRADAPSYVERSADRDLLEGLLRGDFCYVLTSRQMGKSSLMVRTASRLRQRNVHVAALDLTAIGQNLTPNQWYDGLLLRLGRQVNLEPELDQFWHDHPRLGPCQRFFTALRDLVLPHLDQAVSTTPTSPSPPSNPNPQGHTPPPRLVIFVDEIDAVRSLPFSTDEFFAAIRECYNRRSQDPQFHRVTFCLLGVATPTDLINDPNTTPFNIGRRVDLDDFTEEEAFPLAAGLNSTPDSQPTRDLDTPRRMLRRILHWTGGHPYLTQRLCRVAAESAAQSATNRHLPPGPEWFVDRLCNELYLSSRARERDDNLIFVRERLLRADTDLTALLELYQAIHAGRSVPDDPANPCVSLLKLSGITRVTNGHLEIRNHIYRQVFDRAWIAANLPGAELRRQRRAYRRGLLRGLALAALALLLGVSVQVLHRRAQLARQIESTIATLGSVYQNLDTYQDRAEVQLDMGLEGAGLVAQGECSIAFQAPNRFQLHLQLRLGLMETELQFISDGTNAWLHLPALNQHLVANSPIAPPEFLRAVNLEWLLAAPLTLYTAVATANPHEQLTHSIDSPILVLNQDPWEERDACLLSFDQRFGPDSVPALNPNLPNPPPGHIPTRLRVTTRDGLIRAITLDLSPVVQSATIPQVSGGAPREVPLRSFIVSSRHRQIRLNEPIPPDTFRFVPPPGSIEVSAIDSSAIFLAGRSTDTEPLFDRSQLARLIPPRSPMAGPDQIDLTPLFNAPLTEPWHSSLGDNTLSDLPRGLQDFAGVQFDIRGIVQLAGTAEPYLRRLYAERAPGIPIDRSFDRIHLLHATGWNAPDGTHVASLVLRYADGQHRALPILYGYHVRNWWPQAGELPFDRTGLTLAWQRPHHAESPRRLFVTTWDNPRPDVPVATIDYVSAVALPAPFLLAITVESRDIH
jgi:outer membrane lipoprotein-sorting protein